jgi:hypothetical protein
MTHGRVSGPTRRAEGNASWWRRLSSGDAISMHPVATSAAAYAHARLVSTPVFFTIPFLLLFAFRS